MASSTQISSENATDYGKVVNCSNSRYLILENNARTYRVFPGEKNDHLYVYAKNAVDTRKFRLLFQDCNEVTLVLPNYCSVEISGNFNVLHVRAASICKLEFRVDTPSTVHLHTTERTCYSVTNYMICPELFMYARYTAYKNSAGVVEGDQLHATAEFVLHNWEGNVTVAGPIRSLTVLDGVQTISGATKQQIDCSYNTDPDDNCIFNLMQTSPVTVKNVSVFSNMGNF